MLEMLLIVTSLSIDALVVSFAYGANNFKISTLQKWIITSVCSVILILSLSIGQLLQTIFPGKFTTFACFTILAFLGIMRLLESLIKRYLEYKPNREHNLNFSALGVKLNLNITLPKSKLPDEYKLLTPKEALSLGIALSFDSIAVGIGVGLVNIGYLQVTFISMVISFLMISLGNVIGYQLSRKVDLDLSWISGLILLLIAVSKLA